MAYPTAGMTAGLTTATSSAEAALLSGPANLTWYGSDRLAAATIDAGNTPTTTLRPGLILGRITASGLLTEYNPDATNGAETPVCILADAVSMVGGTGSTEIKDCNVLMQGPVTVSSGVIGGISGQDGALDAFARTVLRERYTFDDELPTKKLGWRQENVATDTTVTAAKNGTLYIATAAATFTLPTIAYGLQYKFLMVADANLAITGAASTLIRSTSATYGTTATFSTASSKFGANATVTAVYVGSTLKWMLEIGSGSFVCTMS